MNEEIIDINPNCDETDLIFARECANQLKQVERTCWMACTDQACRQDCFDQFAINLRNCPCYERKQ